MSKSLEESNARHDLVRAVLDYVAHRDYPDRFESNSRHYEDDSDYLRDSLDGAARKLIKILDRK